MDVHSTVFHSTCNPLFQQKLPSVYLFYRNQLFLYLLTKNGTESGTLLNIFFVFLIKSFITFLNLHIN